MGVTEGLEGRFLSVGETARFLEVSEFSVRLYCNAGKLRSIRIGGRRAIDKASAEAILRQRAARKRTRAGS